MRDCGRFRRFIKVDLVKIVSVFGVVRVELSVVRGGSKVLKVSPLTTEI